MALSLDKKLNLVLPIERTNSKNEETIAAYVYSIPLNKAAFDANYALIGQTFTRITTGGYGAVAGPRLTIQIMKEIDVDATERLMTEVKRLTMFGYVGNEGWDKIPFTEAISKDLIDDDETSEVENALAFFIVASAMYKKSENRRFMLGMATLWGGLPTSSTFTEFLASLKTSTETGNSGEKVSQLSIPR